MAYGNACNKRKGNHHLLTTVLMVDCEEVSNLVFMTVGMANPSAADTAPAETDTGGCMLLRPFLELCELFSAKGIRPNVMMR